MKAQAEALSKEVIAVKEEFEGLRGVMREEERLRMRELID